MATATISGHSIKAVKDVNEYLSAGACAFAPDFDSETFSDEAIAASLFAFDVEDIENKILAQLKQLYRKSKEVVVAIEDANGDIDYVDSGKTRLLVNEDGTFTIYNPDFEKLPEGVIADVKIRFQVPPEKSDKTLVISETTLKIIGSNEAPLVEAALESVTDEDQAAYAIDLLQGASDIDHGAVLNVVNVVESNGNAVGWSLQENTIVVDPAAYGYLNDGESRQLNFTYDVADEHGASVAQTLSIDIEGITDPPTLEVTSSAGSDANEVVLHVVSTQAAKEQVKLAFLGLPEGAKVYDGETDVTGGIDNFFADGYDGSHDFTVVFNSDVDLSTAITVEVTGIHPAHGSYPDKALSNSQDIEIHYDVNETKQDVAFTNSDLNMWGDFGTPVIEWHEYLPVLGNDFMEWSDGAWRQNDIARWESGTITLADVSFSSDDITDKALSGLKATKDAAVTALEVAQEMYEDAKEVVKKIADFDAAKIVEDEFNKAQDSLDYYLNNEAAAKQGLRNAIYNDAYGSAYNDAWWALKISTLGLASDEKCADVGRIAGDAAGDLAVKTYDIFGTIADSVPGLNDLLNAIAKATSDVLHFMENTYNSAKDAYNKIAGTIGALEKLVNNAVNDFGKAFDVDVGNISDWDSYIKNTLEKALDAAVEGSAAFAKQVAEAAYDEAESAVNALDFSTELKVDADISGYAGVLVDFRLDGGSVNTDVPYSFSSKVQYNQTTDMLAITPTLVNLTNGEEAAFTTASPNVAITAKLLYDVSAALDVYLNGELKFSGQGFDLGDGIHFNPIFSTSGSNMQFTVLDETQPILDENGLNLNNLGVKMVDGIVPYNEMFVGMKTDPIGTPGEITLFDFASSTGDLSVPFYSTNIYESGSDKLSNVISSITEGMIEKIELALPYIETEGKYVSQETLLTEYMQSPEYAYNKLFDGGYDPAKQSFGQSINDYYYDETFKTLNFDQITSIFENATLSLGKEIAALLDLEYLQQQGYTNLTTYLAGADIGAIIKDVSANFAQNAFDLFLENLDGKYTTDSFVIVDMTQGESDALFHINSLSFNSDDLISNPTNPDSWPNPLLPYQDKDITDDTAAFGLYVASGESDPMYKITLDVDEVAAFVLRKVVQAATGIILPDSASPFKMGGSLDDMLSIAEVDKGTRETVKKYIDLGMTVDRMDYDVSSSIDFSQDFTLTVDDMSYLLTFTEAADGNNPVTMLFQASEADKIVIADASQYDVNKDGTIDYDLQIIPTAMFSNDTELGYNYGLSLDFLKTELDAKIGLPLGDLLDIPDLPNLSYTLLDYDIGPVLDIDAQLNALDIDVWESRFNIDIGKVLLAKNGVDIYLTGLQDSADNTAALLV